MILQNNKAEICVQKKFCNDKTKKSQMLIFLKCPNFLKVPLKCL